MNNKNIAKKKEGRKIRRKSKGEVKEKAKESQITFGSYFPKKPLKFPLNSQNFLCYFLL